MTQPEPKLPENEKQALQAELAQRQRNLSILEERSAKFGINVPLDLTNQIADEKERIKEIENRLSGLTDEPSPAAQYFSMASRAQITDDLWEARRYYEMTLALDPHYPRASEQLNQVEWQITQKERPFADATVLQPSGEPVPKTSESSSWLKVGCIIVAIAVAVLASVLGFLSGWLSML